MPPVNSAQFLELDMDKNIASILMQGPQEIYDDFERSSP